MGRLLIVDDDPAILRALGRILGAKHEVVARTSAAEALCALQRERYDAVLVDSQMPEMTGYEFIERALEFNPCLARRLILMSGLLDVDPPSGIPLLPKPFEFDELERLVEQRASIASSRPPKK